MALLNFLQLVPHELRFQILFYAGAKACANLSITCRDAMEMIQKDDYLWKALFAKDLCDVGFCVSYAHYQRLAISHLADTSAYAWYWHVVTCCCTVCLCYIPSQGAIIRRGGIDLCRDCERDLEQCQKIYDV